NFNDRLTILANGFIGINQLNPAYQLDVSSSASVAVNINQTGSNSDGLAVRIAGGNINNRGIFVVNPANASLPNNFSVGVHAISGSGPFFLSPTSNYGVIGESQNPVEGNGVMGISNSPSPQLIQAAVVGNNFSNSASAYGIIGRSSGASGAGTVGHTSNATAGLLGYAHITATGPAIKSTSLPGSSLIGLELENGAIKVSGANPTAFRHAATAGNTTSNETIIPNTTQANSGSDMLIVTPFWDGTYVNAPIGVYFSAGTWRIFRQDLQPMPVGAKFNVLVIKQ
ncbi:MAG: hypothetical protein JNM68_06015, partial [Dinghuibacter sp.]|nr:hypothetical protein [Dinghuibacter sp.]